MSQLKFLLSNNQEKPKKSPTKSNLSRTELLAKRRFEENERKKQLEEKQRLATLNRLRQEERTKKQNKQNAKITQLQTKQQKSQIKQAQKEKTESRKSQMNIKKFEESFYYKPVLLIFFSLLGLLLYFILPNSYKIFSFILPAFTLSWAFSKKNFNFQLLLVFGLIFLLFPTSFFTLDAAQSVNWQMVRVQNIIQNVANVASGIFLIGIPIIGVIGSVYAFAIGNISNAITSLVKVILVAILVITFVALAKALNIPILSDISFFDSIASFIMNAYDSLMNGLGNVMNQVDFLDWFPDIPDTPSPNITLNLLDEPQKFRLIIIGSYPINLCVLGVVIAIITLLLKKPFPSFQLEQNNELSRPYQINYEFLVFLVFILIAYFTLYLWTGETNFLTYRNLGFFTIYLVIIVSSCIILAFGFGSISQMKWKSMLGFLYGLFALFLVFNLFTQDRTFELLSIEQSDTNLTIYNIIIQFLAIGPGESFLFHVTIPGLTLYIIFLRIKRYNNVQIDAEITNKRSIIDRLTLENQFYQIQLMKPKIADQQQLLITKTTGDTDDYVMRLKEIQLLSNQIKSLELAKQKSIDFNSNELSRGQKILFYVSCSLSNLLFSMMHYLNSGMDFALFWNSGLGLIYLFSGLILTFISFRYGWLTGILVHSVNNSWSLLMVFLTGGI